LRDSFSFVALLFSFGTCFTAPLLNHPTPATVLFSRDFLTHLVFVCCFFGHGFRPPFLFFSSLRVDPFLRGFFDPRCMCHLLLFLLQNKPNVPVFSLLLMFSESPPPTARIFFLPNGFSFLLLPDCCFFLPLLSPPFLFYVPLVPEACKPTFLLGTFPPRIRFLCPSPFFPPPVALFSALPLGSLCNHKLTPVCLHPPLSPPPLSEPHKQDFFPPPCSFPCPFPGSQYFRNPLFPPLLSPPLWSWVVFPQLSPLVFRPPG